MYQFFKPNLTELNQIIRQRLDAQDEQVISSKVLQTGWTNITMDVKATKDAYIFRFPRNLFFAQAMIKDCEACAFLRGKISAPVPKMRLLMDKGRPFSMHAKIKGETLDKLLPHLSVTEKTTIADDLGRFLAELQAIPIQTAPPIMKKTLNAFLLDLAKVHQGDYDNNRHRNWSEIERSASDLHLAHGDFHPGNILIGSDKKVVGVIDFAFTTISDRHADLGRFYCRSEPEMSRLLIAAYQRHSGKSCEQQKIAQMADLFHYVDTQYVKYMQRAHPEIVIPKMLLSSEK